MGKAIDWFNIKNIDIEMHVNNKQSDCAPSPILRIHLMVVAKFSCFTTNNFKILQVHHFTVAMQWTRLMYMQTSMLHAVGGDGPLSP